MANDNQSTKFEDLLVNCTKKNDLPAHETFAQKEIRGFEKTAATFLENFSVGLTVDHLTHRMEIR